ncbi:MULTISPECIES: ribonuclease HII [unclassified Helicobacter]|uniref:ribonuclease HII n=1 Tax=unclassified Helicobacter TaxID=2593540 RepID=UPI000CF0AE18|nr:MULTISPECIES: ribonuclease HII [unclassified Helicobacter]
MICGIDEAGRGSLCGSLFVSGVGCDEKTALLLQENGIKDSKKLSKDARYKMSSIIQNTPNLVFITIEKNAKEIDSKGLSLCLKESIIEIIQAFQTKITNFYLDGNTTFGIKLPDSLKLISIIQGDNKIPQISAASILAKNAKDKEMEKLHQNYPEYNFIQNAGYGTKSHLDRIQKLGYTPYHRKSFVIKSSQKNTSLF